MTGDQLKIERVEKKKFEEDEYYDEEYKPTKEKEKELKFSKLELLQLVNRGNMNHESDEDSDWMYE